MVGALSIVRFRTAIKDPLDTIFMFWSIAVGIVLGARLYTVAALASAIIGVVLLVWNLFKSKKNYPFMMVLRFEEGCKKEVQALLRKMPPGPSEVQDRVRRHHRADHRDEHPRE